MKNNGPTKKSNRTCPEGHIYFKSSDCPVCPICEKIKNQNTDLFASLPAPAKRALENAGIRTLIQLSEFSRKKLLELHGMGPSSIPKIEEILRSYNLSLNKS